MVVTVIHDLNGPSQLSKREGCPGSAHQEARLVVDVTGPDARETIEEDGIHADRGRRLHEVMSDALLCNRAPSITDHPKLTEEDVDALTLCWEAVMPFLATCGADDLWLVESHLDLVDLDIPKGGTVDLAVVQAGKRFWLWDWKFGGSPVKRPRYNRQMQAYAWGIWHAFGCTEGDVSVVQPAAGTPVRTDSFSGQEIMAYGSEIREIVSRTKPEDAPLIPGEHCGFCKARHTCPARRALSEATIATAKPTNVIATVRTMEPAKRLEFYERLKLAKSWVEQALGSIEGGVLDGSLDVPGLTTGEGRKTRSWVSETLATPVLEELLGDRAYSKELVSPAEAEKRLGKSRAMQSKLRGVIVSTPGKPRVVRSGTTGSIEE